MARRLDHILVVDVAMLERVERRSILVQPARSTVSAYCTQLTTLTQADVDAGIPLAEACRVLAKEYESKERLFASFGDYDARQFERNCAEFGIVYRSGDASQRQEPGAFALWVQSHCSSDCC